MKKCILAAFYFLWLSIVYGQQDKQYTHYMFDLMSYNPATTGFKGFCGTLIYRNQWDRVQDAPNTTLFNAQGNLENLKLTSGNLGVGLSFSNDAIGFQRNNNIVVNVAYHLSTGYGSLSGGVGFGIINVGFSPDWIPPLTAAALDPSIAPINMDVSQTGFDSNLGLFWYGNEDYYVGISTTHLAPPNLSNVSYNVARHYYVLAGYKYDVGSKMIGSPNPIDLRPGVLIKTDGVTSVFDVNVMADVWLDTESYIWGGFTYRYSDAIALMIGYAKNGLKFGYSFDIMTNPLNEYGKGTHELMVKYCLFPPKRPITGGGLPTILQ